LAQAYSQRHLCAEATSAAERWAAVAPGDPEALKTLGVLTGDLTRLKESDPELASDLAVEGGWSRTCDGPCRLRLGLILIRREDWALGACALESALATDAEEAEAHVWLGEALSRLGRRQAAQTHLKTAVKLAPSSPQAWLLLGSYYLTGGQVESAREALLTAHRLDPENPAPCLAMAEVKARAGRYQEVSTWIEAALDRAPQDPEIWKAVARFYLSRNLEHEAHPKDAAEAAVVMAPEDAEAQMLLGWSHLAKGETPNALTALDRALELDPALAEAHYLRAQALRAAGRPTEAEASLTRAADLGYAPAWEN
jgi:tetratricopeptide (TPR) repeat protein